MGQISTVTVGSDSASVYALTSNALTDADSFWNLRIGADATAWAAGSDDDKERCLNSASDWIDRSQDFSGEKTVAAQDREWPRDGASCSGTAIDDGTTPDALALACFWLAGQIIVNNSIQAGEGTGSNVRSAKAGTAKVEFFSQTAGNRLPQTAYDYLACFNDSAIDSLGGTATGIDRTTAFDSDDFLRSGPL